MSHFYIESDNYKKWHISMPNLIELSSLIYEFQTHRRQSKHPRTCSVLHVNTEQEKTWALKQVATARPPQWIKLVSYLQSSPSRSIYSQILLHLVLNRAKNPLRMYTLLVYNLNCVPMLTLYWSAVWLGSKFWVWISVMMTV